MIQHLQETSYVDPLSSSSSQFYHHPSQPITNRLQIVKIRPLFPNNDQEEGGELERRYHEDWRDGSHYSRNPYENHHMRIHDDNNNYD